MAVVVLLREEWDFSPCRDEHLEACYYYEFARESEKAKDAESKYRAAIESAPEREAKWLLTCRMRGVYNFFQCCPEFPDTPFLCIPKRERDQRIKKLWKPRRLIQANLSSIIRTREADFSQAKTLKYPTGYAGGDIREGEIVAFFVDWNLPLPCLVKDFQRWLDENKPDGAGKPAKRGAGATPRQIKKRLKALGAVRLLRRMDYFDAYEHTKAVLRDKKGERCPLFGQDASAWSRAKKEGNQAIKSVCRLIEALSN